MNLNTQAQIGQGRGQTFECVDRADAYDVECFAVSARTEAKRIAFVSPLFETVEQARAYMESVAASYSDVWISRHLSFFGESNDPERLELLAEIVPAKRQA